MNTKILQKISYGLFVVTTSFEGKDTGCIINTACQVATEMNAVTISVNKANYTCEMIQKAKRFNISVIDQSATFDLFKHFGFQSGRDTDKFAGFNDCKRTANGCMAVTKGTNAFFSVSVIVWLSRMWENHSCFVYSFKNATTTSHSQTGYINIITAGRDGEEYT